MKFKSGISLDIQRELAAMLPVIDMAHADVGLPRDSVVTSANDGKHMDGSLHYRGLALDLRTRDLGPEKQKELLAALKNRLGPNYDVILEVDHIHLEFDPK